MRVLPPVAVPCGWGRPVSSSVSGWLGRKHLEVGGPVWEGWEEALSLGAGSLGGNRPGLDADQEA